VHQKKETEGKGIVAMDEEEEPKLVEPTEPLEPELALDQNEASTPEDMGDMQGEEDGEEPGADRSWLPTIAVGIAALVLGLFLGYLGRGQFGPEAQAARATQTAVAQVSATRAAAGQELMKNLVDHARHIKGSPDAKSIIIEFSDFQ